jgi:hypothetical protein
LTLLSACDALRGSEDYYGGGSGWDTGSENTWGKSGGGGEGGDGGGGCDVTVSNLVPGDGSTTAYAQADIEWAISAADGSATITVTDAAGGAVSGTTSASEDGVTIRFTPDSPLAASTSYTTQISVCDGAGGGTASFSTSDVGTVIDAGSTEGRVYAFDLFSGRILQPPGIGPLLQPFIGDVEWLASPFATDGVTMDWRMGLGDGSGNQDTCSPSVSVLGADFTSNPFFAFGPAPTVFEVQGATIKLDDLYLSGAFSPDVLRLEGIVLSGLLDTRPLADLVAPGGAPDAFCQLALTFGDWCQSCPDGQLLCLPVEVDSLQADAVPSTMVEITQAEIGADPTCN